MRNWVRGDRARSLLVLPYFIKLRAFHHLLDLSHTCFPSQSIDSPAHLGMLEQPLLERRRHDALHTAFPITQTDTTARCTNHKYYTAIIS